MGWCVPVLSPEPVVWHSLLILPVLGLSWVPRLHSLQTGGHIALVRVDASAVVEFLFVSAAAGLPNALPDAATTSCLAHACSLFGVLPLFQGRRCCTEGGLRSWCNPAAVPGPVLPSPFPQIHTCGMDLGPSWFITLLRQGGASGCTLQTAAKEYSWELQPCLPLQNYSGKLVPSCYKY